MSTWVDTENADNKSAYKLPHHKAKGHAVVWRGVAAAMSRLGQTQIPEGDRQGVYNHLAKHYKQFGKEPPDFKLLWVPVPKSVVTESEYRERMRRQVVTEQAAIAAEVAGDLMDRVLGRV